MDIVLLWFGGGDSGRGSCAEGEGERKEDAAVDGEEHPGCPQAGVERDMESGSWRAGAL